MNRWIRVLIMVLALMLVASWSFAAITAYKKTARTGGGASAMDGVDGATLTDGSMAEVFDSGVSVVWKYELDATCSESESDPDIIVPDTNPGTKCWRLIGKISKSPIIEYGTDRFVTGKWNYINVAANSGTTLSGTSVFATAITGVSTPARPMTSGITLFMVSPSGGENCMIYNDSDTASSGNTLYVHFQPGDTVKSNVACTAGVSKYIISGTTLEKKLVMWSNGAGVWVIDAVGTPTVEAK